MSHKRKRESSASSEQTQALPPAIAVPPAGSLSASGAGGLPPITPGTAAALSLPLPLPLPALPLIPPPDMAPSANNNANGAGGGGVADLAAAAGAVAAAAAVAAMEAPIDPNTGLPYSQLDLLQANVCRGKERRRRCGAGERAWPIGVVIGSGMGRCCDAGREALAEDPAATAALPVRQCVLPHHCNQLPLSLSLSRSLAPVLRVPA
jgi:hypothetical protein